MILCIPSSNPAMIDFVFYCLSGGWSQNNQLTPPPLEFDGLVRKSKIVIIIISSIRAIDCRNDGVPGQTSCNIS